MEQNSRRALVQTEILAQAKLSSEEMDSMEVDDNIYKGRSVSVERLLNQVSSQSRQKSPGCVTVCLAVLCAVLLAANIGQVIHYELIIHPTSDPSQANDNTHEKHQRDNEILISEGGRLQGNSSASTTERKHLEEVLSNLTKDRDQLQRSYDSLVRERQELLSSRAALTAERDEFKASFSNLKTERRHIEASYNTSKHQSDQLQTSYDVMYRDLERLQIKNANLTTSKDQLQTNYSILQRQKDELQTRVSALMTNSNHLQSNYSSLKRDKDQLWTSCNSLAEEREQLLTSKTTLTTERDELKASVNNLKRERDLLQSNYSSLKGEKDQLEGNYSALSWSENLFQLSYKSLWREKTQLQTSYTTLRREHELLQINYSSLAHSRDQFQKKNDKMAVKVRGMLCQSGWRKFDISCYLISSMKKNWTESRRDCIDRGGDLVIIDSRDEQVFVHGLLGYGQNAWIGLSDALTEGTWIWVDGRSVTTAFWQPGQPNNLKNQNCGEIIHRTSGGVGEWNDDGCFAQQLWICEK